MQESAQNEAGPVLVPAALFVAAFFLPSVVSPTGEEICGYELTIQGAFLLLIALLTFLHEPWELWFVLMPWFGNAVFFWAGFLAYRARFTMAAAWSVGALAMMGSYLIAPQAVFDGSGEGPGEVEIVYGYYVWLAAPATMLLISLICRRRGPHA